MTSPTEAFNPAQRAQQARDLLGQVSELQGEVGSAEQPEIVFQEVSPKRQKVTIYSMVDGEPLRIPRNLMVATLNKRIPETGGFMFTAFKNEAPEYKLGEVKCFLHPKAPDRVILEQIGLGGATCNADHLANAYSKRMHGLHRHKSEWAMYQEFLMEQKETETIARAERQLEATLAIAQTAGNAPKAATK